MILIKGSRVMDPGSGRDETADILMESSRISAVGRDLRATKGAVVIDGRGLIASPGFIDVHVHFRDPGFTYKEDIGTGALAAAAGGYTTVVCMANTHPVADNPETVRYVLEQGRRTKIRVLTAASVTKGMEGKELTDMRLLKESGAVGFTDDGKPLMDETLVREAMRLARELSAPLSFHEENPAYIAEAGVNAGPAAKGMGLKGASWRAEADLTARDIELALETGADVNIQHISSGEAVRLVRDGRKRGKNIHAEATPHHFSLTEETVARYGTMAKMNPPLRGEEDRREIIRGLADGTIDLIATDHAPHSAQEKGRPFTEAPSGIIGLETALALGITNLVRPGHLPLMELLRKMTLNPAKLYRLDAGRLEAGAAADITLFDPDKLWRVEKFFSKASNSPFLGAELYGKVMYTVAAGEIAYRAEW